MIILNDVRPQKLFPRRIDWYGTFAFLMLRFFRKIVFPPCWLASRAARNRRARAKIKAERITLIDRWKTRITGDREGEGEDGSEGGSERARAGRSKCIRDPPENRPGKALPRHTKSPSPSGIYPRGYDGGWVARAKPGQSLYFIHVSFHPPVCT